MQEKTRFELDIETIEKNIKQHKKSIENLEQKLHSFNEIKQKYNPDVLLGKDFYICYKDIDKCNKVGFNGTCIFLYFLNDGIKILGKDVFELYQNSWNYRSSICIFHIKNYDKYIPQDFPNRKYIIKKIEKRILKDIIKTKNAELNEYSYNFDYYNGQLVFA